MSESTEPTKFTKLRTTIIVVSMIVMPLCAVVGVKMPKFLNDLTTGSVGVSSSDTKSKPAARPSGSGSTAARDQERAKKKPLERAVSLAEAEAGHGSHDHASHSGHDSPPTPIFAPTGSYASLASQQSGTANTDVRAGGSGVSQAVALEALAGSPSNVSLSSGTTNMVGFDKPGTIQPLPPADDSARPTQTPPSGGAGGADQFSHIQTRLKALGATHYTLETWGAGGNSYRFQCRMAAGHSADYTRQFEATDTDPLRTMQTVLDEVEAWKSGRLP